MNSKRHLYFRWTPLDRGYLADVDRAVVPSIIGYVAYKTDVSGMTPGIATFGVLGIWVLMWTRALSISRRRGGAIRSLSDKGMRGLEGSVVCVYERQKLQFIA